MLSFALRIPFRSEPPSPQNSSTDSKGDDLLIDEFDEDDFNPRAFENTSNGITNHLANNNSTNGQITAGAIFTQTNGINSPPLR